MENERSEIYELIEDAYYKTNKKNQYLGHLLTILDKTKHSEAEVLAKILILLTEDIKEKEHVALRSVNKFGVKKIVDTSEKVGYTILEFPDKDGES